MLMRARFFFHIPMESNSPRTIDILYGCKILFADNFLEELENVKWNSTLFIGEFFRKTNTNVKL